MAGIIDLDDGKTEFHSADVEEFCRIVIARIRQLEDDRWTNRYRAILKTLRRHVEDALDDWRRDERDSD